MIEINYSFFKIIITAMYNVECKIYSVGKNSRSEFLVNNKFFAVAKNTLIINYTL